MRIHSNIINGVSVASKKPVESIPVDIILGVVKLNIDTCPTITGRVCVCVPVFLRSSFGRHGYFGAGAGTCTVP